MKIISLLSTVFTFLLVVAISHADNDKVFKGDCATCKEITKNFARGIDATKKSNYGGGNTEWEESRLGQYANSEVRLVEIMEVLCMDSTKECPLLVERNEEFIDKFWADKSLEKNESTFYDFFCIKNAKACCPEQTYGPECKDCPGGKERPCKNNGQCVGGGTREGTGKCKCNPGYKGKLCDTCTAGYYEHMKNESHTVCKVCHIACRGSCTGYGAAKCNQCREGWDYNQEKGCHDINECEKNPCSPDEYCFNTEGSHACMSCHVSCDGCSGLGSDRCTKCRDGYRMEAGRCVDINECTEQEFRCQMDGQKCENTVGSYKCGCQQGYFKDGYVCKRKPDEEQPDDVEVEKDNTQQPDHDPSDTQNLDIDTTKEEL